MPRRIELDLAPPIGLGGIGIRQHNSRAPKSLGILLHHGENRVRHHPSADVHEHVVIAHAVQPIDETDERRGGLARAARAGHQDPAPAQPERCGVGETHARRGVGPVEEEAQGRSRLPWRHAELSGQRLNADPRGPVVELPRRRVVIVESALVASGESSVEVPRREPALLIPRGRRLPAIRFCVHRVELDPNRRGIRVSALDQPALAQLGEPRAREPCGYVCPPQLKVASRQARLRIGERGLEPILSVHLQACHRRHLGRRRP